MAWDLSENRLGIAVAVMADSNLQVAERSLVLAVPSVDMQHTANPMAQVRQR